MRGHRVFFGGLVVLGVLCTAAIADDVAYTYDALGRLQRVDYANGSSTVYNYDAAGNRTSVSYGGQNAAPAAVNDSVSTNAKAALTFDPRLNDTDPDNDPLTVTQTGTPTAPGHGTVAINSGQTITYTPNATFPVGAATGTDNFSYSISDGQGHSATASVTV